MNLNKLNKMILALNIQNITITRTVNTDKYYNAYFNINKSNIKLVTDLENYCYAESMSQELSDNNITKFNMKMLYDKTINEEHILKSLNKIFNYNEHPKYNIEDRYHIYNTNKLTKYEINYESLKYNNGSTIINLVSVPKELLLSQKQLIKLLINEIKKINMNNNYKHYIFPQDDNIFRLTIRLFINPNTVIGKQLEEIKKRYGYDYIELQMIIDSTGYPYIAPKLEYIKPHAYFSFILSIINMDFLKQYNWSPLISLEFFILNLVDIIEKLDKQYILYDENKNQEIDKHINKLLSISKTQFFEKIDFKFSSTYQNTQTDKKSHWVSGTGYGSNDIKSDWDINKFIKEQDIINIEHHECLKNIVEILQKYINKTEQTKNSKIPFGQIYICIIYKHCIGHIVNINLLEFQNNTQVYIRIFQLLVLILSRLTQNEINVIGKKLKHFSDEIDYIVTNHPTEIYITIQELLKHLISQYIAPIEEIVVLSDSKDSYCHAMKTMQFGHFDLDAKHSYYSKKDDKIEQKSVMRILSEISSLKKNLPLNWETSIWMRVSKTNFNIISVVIAGPKNTPYENGLFEFHVYLPTDYPNTAPSVLINTTDGGKVRFNPNLYANGKVCLSLLGTWSGSGGEVWNKQTSSLLQVLVSIQSLILVDDPYFNEPGYEKYMKDEKFIQASKAYNEEKQISTINLAMINMIKNPIIGFEDVVKEHFTKKKEEILNRMEIWIQNAKNKDAIKSKYDELKVLLDKL